MNERLERSFMPIPRQRYEAAVGLGLEESDRERERTHGSRQAACDPIG
jgi:hypothetical protein